MFIIILSLLHYLATATCQVADLADNSFLWGPYRPNLYVGFRALIPKSLLTGLMWANADNPSSFQKNLRYTCEQDEGMAGYGWTRYDPRKGGTQIINDTGNNVDITAQFAKVSDDDWGLRLKGIPRSDNSAQRTTVIFYIGSEDQVSHTKCTRKLEDQDQSRGYVDCTGLLPTLGTFSIRTLDHDLERDSKTKTSTKSLMISSDTIWQAKSIYLDKFEEKGNPDGLPAADHGEGNLHFIQKSFEGGFEFDILFSVGPNSNRISSRALTTAIDDAMSTFDHRFKSVYAPQAPFNEESHIKFSQSLLANLMGGIGYFYGTSRVDVSSDPAYEEVGESFWEGAASARTHAEVNDQGPYQLLSAVPSRPFFPRGFLWDEGFHLQVILRYDMDLALKIVSSWFDLMDENGWIAREQILGPEARSKVPPEFQTQYPHYANPPTLFLVIQTFIATLNGEWSYSGAQSRHLKNKVTGTAFLKEIYPKLKTHYDWFRRTQAGNLQPYQRAGFKPSEGYRWRGRTPQHILTSGLDDYPRARPPHAGELHLDALCWVGVMTTALENVSAFLGDQKDEKMFAKHKAGIVESIDILHWSEADRAFCDLTVVEGGKPKKVCHKGYISLFPFITGLMDADHPSFEAVLDLIRTQEELWSPHGIRSLSLKDRFYGTEENYWRGPIWININYMILTRLMEIAQQPGPHQARCRAIYTELRLNLVSTVFESWKETGFAWEQYDPDTGEGQRTQHFAGWTSLIVIIQAMPDLQSDSLPQVPEHSDPKISVGTWDIRLALAVVAMLFLCTIFRKRAIRLCRRLTTRPE